MTLADDEYVADNLQTDNRWLDLVARKSQYVQSISMSYINYFILFDIYNHIKITFGRHKMYEIWFEDLSIMNITVTQIVLDLRYTSTVINTLTAV